MVLDPYGGDTVTTANARRAVVRYVVGGGSSTGLGHWRAPWWRVHAEANEAYTNDGAAWWRPAHVKVLLTTASASALTTANRFRLRQVLGAPAGVADGRAPPGARTGGGGGGERGARE